MYLQFCLSPLLVVVPYLFGLCSPAISFTLFHRWSLVWRYYCHYTSSRPRYTILFCAGTGGSILGWNCGFCSLRTLPLLPSAHIRRTNPSPSLSPSSSFERLSPRPPLSTLLASTPMDIHTPLSQRIAMKLPLSVQETLPKIPANLSPVSRRYPRLKALPENHQRSPCSC